jgi:hypothetical protein
MAESGVNYRLSSGTLAAVKGAGIGGKAQEHLAKAAGAEALQGIVKGVEEQIVEKQEDTASREEAWDVGFDAMDDKGAWASGELFDQFQTIEASYKDEYLEAVRKGDRQKQKRMLKDQGSRSSGLQGWKGTMETAKQIHDGVGWSQSFLGPKNAENREIIKALTKLDGETATVRFGDQGEMVFDIKLKNGKTRTMTRREVDDMLAKGVKPLKQEKDFMVTIQASMELGASGKPFNKNSTQRNNEINITDDMIPALIREDFGGGGTFAEHIKSHPDMITQFADVIGNNDGSIDDKEVAKMKALIDTDMDVIIDAMEQDPGVARGYLAEWQTAQQEVAWEQGRAEHQTKTTSKTSGAREVPAAVQIAEWEKREKLLKQQERTKRYEAKRKPIVIGGKEDFGSLSQYSKNDKGEWMYNYNPTNPETAIKVRDFMKGKSKEYVELFRILEGQAGPSGLLDGAMFD